MKNKEIQEEIIVDYVAKERSEKSGRNSILNAFLAWGISITYMAYTFCSVITALNEKPVSDESFYGLFLMLSLMFAVPLAFLYVSLPHESIGKEIEAARKFLLEAGQEATNKNINILLDRYYRGGWQKIEDMLYETRRQNLKEALPAK